MPGIVPSVEFNDQLIKVVRENESRQRSSRAGTSPFYSGTRKPALYITHDELIDVTTPVQATRLKQSVYTSAQIVLEDDSDYRVRINGFDSQLLRADMTATEIRGVLQQLLPGLSFEVFAYTGRVLVVATEENSAALSEITLSVGNGYAQEFHSTKGTVRNVYAVSANGSNTIPAGTLCWGEFILGIGDRVIPECRTYAGDVVTPTLYVPPDEDGGESAWYAFTGPSTCTPTLPSGSDWVRRTAQEPTASSDIELEFTGGHLLIPAAKWSYVAASGQWDITIELTNGSCDFHSSGFSITQGSPSGSPSRWRHT